jgi:hypothetical protein
MAEGSQETEDQSVQVPRASTAPALPAIITTTTTTVRSRKDGQRNDDNSFTNDSPSVATPGLLRTSQSFPVGMCNSYRLPFKDWSFRQICQ